MYTFHVPIACVCAFHHVKQFMCDSTCTTPKTGWRHKPLLVQEGQGIVNKVDATPNVPCTKITEGLGISVWTLNEDILNWDSTQSVSEQPRCKIAENSTVWEGRSSIYGIEPAKAGSYWPVDCTATKEKADNIAQKLSAEFRLSTGWIDVANVLVFTNKQLGDWTCTMKKEQWQRTCVFNIWCSCTQQKITVMLMSVVYFILCSPERRVHSKVNVSRAWESRREDSPFLCLVALGGCEAFPLILQGSQNNHTSHLLSWLTFMHDVGDIPWNFWPVSTEEWHQVRTRCSLLFVTALHAQRMQETCSKWCLFLQMKGARECLCLMQWHCLQWGGA